jgi:hypothetical protein
MAVKTPWGPSQTERVIADGITLYTTASHGGILLSPERNARVPEYMRNSSGWYEEDCEMMVPWLVFEADVRAWADKTDWTTGDFQMKCAHESVRNRDPDSYEKFYGVKLGPAESRARARQAFAEKDKNDWIVTTAWGDWAVGVPAGMIGVCASKGFDHGQADRQQKPEKWFILPKAEYYEYLNSGAIGFVIDLARHQEIPAGQINGQSKPAAA